MSKEGKIKEKFDIKSIYTPLSVAKEEIWKRWNNKELRKKGLPQRQFLKKFFAT